MYQGFFPGILQPSGRLQESAKSHEGHDRGLLRSLLPDLRLLAPSQLPWKGTVIVRRGQIGHEHRRFIYS
jgi:hypothetical protein